MALPRGFPDHSPLSLNSAVPSPSTRTATSTGGRTGTLPGRVGDTAIIGAGRYADDRGGEASATGHGESIILSGLARVAVDGLGDGSHPAVVARRLVRTLGSRLEGEAGIIRLDRFGRLGWATSAEAMSVASRSEASPG